MDEIMATGTDIPLAARVEAMEAALAEARKDSRRLEWVFDILSLTDVDGDAKTIQLMAQVMLKAAGQINTPRAAIDAAMAKGEK